MKITFAILISLPTMLFIGIWYGYSTALDNQVYFDAPAKVVLYSAVLDQDKSDEYLKGKIVERVRILMEKEHRTNRHLLNFPRHKGMKEAYDLYKSQLEKNAYYQEAKNMICTYNKSLHPTAECGD